MFRRLPIPSQNIILIGPMGAGKTTIGRRLASYTGKTFYDSDHEIEAQTGVDIPYIFEREGEKGFRERETCMLKQLAKLNNIILATGGGSVTAEVNRQCLRQTGIVVYLQTPVHVQLERTKHDTQRPLLQTADPAKKLAELLEQRDPLYRATADIVISTEHYSGRSLNKEILKAIHRYQDS